ncbi:MAG: hypothetical protein L0H53_03695 [Candidatus Nitrosocosmicus sp.]|nr:hypothetical protein [Candidatus Nitrosocosmicus sp.]MDN5866823.1 hypothetical protein [Candidatus Nitrosocosmicus sp.]
MFADFYEDKIVFYQTIKNQAKNILINKDSLEIIQIRKSKISLFGYYDKADFEERFVSTIFKELESEIGIDFEKIQSILADRIEFIEGE